jgi:hypothetical protein
MRARDWTDAIMVGVLIGALIVMFLPWVIALFR